MIFTETAFVVFIAIVLPLYYLSRKHHTLNTSILLVASYVFYGWSDWRFTILLFVSSMVDYVCALGLAAAPTRSGRDRWFVGGVGFSLLLLGFFKYAGLMAYTLNALSQGMGASPLLPVFQVALPAGISFYTFQSMSYLIDVHRGTLTPSRSPVTYLLFVSYFPQLVAGPIERASHLLSQFSAPCRIDPVRVADGCCQILAGYLMKTVVADNLAPFVDRVYGAHTQYEAPLLLAATAMFGLQIYCDFAGYSNIAIGLGKLMGYDIMQNFRAPYFARSLQDFWRRWHISLSTFFRDYVYVPLGGSRRGMARTLLNTTVVFLISGLWHGANWTYAAWGLYHGAGLALALMAGRALGTTHRGVQSGWWLLGCALVTQAFVMLGWVLFRAQTFGDAWQIWTRISSPSAYTVNQLHILGEQSTALVIVGVFLGLEFVQRHRTHLLDLDRFPTAWRFTCYAAALISVFLLGSGAKSQFIYFRF